jgi:hypothetical protein
MLSKRAFLLSVGVFAGFLNGCSGDGSPTSPEVPPSTSAEGPDASSVLGVASDETSEDSTGSSETEAAEAESGAARATAPGQVRKDSVVPDQYIVILKPHVLDVPGAVHQLVGEYDLTMRRSYRRVRGFSAVVPGSRLKALEKHPLVEMVVPNTVLHEGGLLNDGDLSTVAGTPASAAAPEEVPGLGLKLRLVADELLATVVDGGGVSVWPNLGTEGPVRRARARGLQREYGQRRGARGGGRGAPRLGDGDRGLRTG